VLPIYRGNTQFPIYLKVFILRTDASNSFFIRWLSENSILVWINNNFADIKTKKVILVATLYTNFLQLQ
jgi:hypothetical protein